MNLNQALEYSTESHCMLFDPVSVDDVVTIDEHLTLDGEGHTLTFTGHFSQIRLMGNGPFRFKRITFRHEHELGPSFFLCQDATVVFEDCAFEGAWGGEEESLASAIKAAGRSRLTFERCQFHGNDQHIMLFDNSKCELRECALQDARADGVILRNSSELSAQEIQVTQSGWSGLNCSGSSTIQLSGSILGENGCHGVELSDDSRYSGKDNLFHENGYNGLSCLGSSSAFSLADQCVSNGICGIDLGERASAVLKKVHACHNQSHGVQVRDDGRVDLADCTCNDNEASGAALFNSACLDGEDINLENNGASGLQSAEKSRVTLCRANVSNNRATSLLCFGRTSIVIERSRLTDSGGHGIQVAEECYAVIRDCEIMENQRSAIIFAGESRGLVEGTTIAHNTQDGLVTADKSKVTAIENLIRCNGRDGILVLSNGAGQLLENQCQKNGRYGLFAVAGSRPLLCDNLCTENELEDIRLETDGARSALRGPSSVEETSQEIPPGVTLTVEDGPDLHLPFEPKKVERTMLVALAKHGRLSEQALRQLANTRRVGGAMENLIDRLNKAGLPIIRHDGDGPEGNIYALKLDTTRNRFSQNTSIQGRQVC